MPKILVIEDSAPNREILKSILSDIADCDFAVDGLQAVQKFNQSLSSKQCYDLMLIDIGLPEISGIDLLAKIRASEEKAGISRGEGIPIIMVTASKEYFLTAYDIGCHD
ncbi:MAG: response regulator [Candidatus Omnitrophota bacterium]